MIISQYGIAALLASMMVAPAWGQIASPSIAIPQSSIANPGDAGLRAHTNIKILNLNDKQASPPNLFGAQPELPPLPNLYYETPASLACVYGLVPKTQACNPQKVTKNVVGGSKVIAIVDAYDDPTALSDLVRYSQQFGLPPITSANFQVIYASGKKPPVVDGWRVEEALDVQMAHALAPNAKVLLVEAASNSLADLFVAERVAANAVALAGGGEVSNSWGSNEFSQETTPTYRSPFTKATVVFFASTGDAPPPSYPAVLPNVVAAGGTTIVRDASGSFLSETSWTSAGAGASTFVARPAYQSAVQSIVGARRGTADLSAVANPNSGVWVYSNGSWLVVGGTSASSPILAAITNTANHFLPSSAGELARMYNHLGTAAFRDVKQGTCGTNQSRQAAVGYDFCTGVGSPLGRNGL